MLSILFSCKTLGLTRVCCGTSATLLLTHAPFQCSCIHTRDLKRMVDWRMGAEHFEACLIDHTPDANWGNWAYRILPRPCLLPGLWDNWRQGDLGIPSGSTASRKPDPGLSVMRKQDERGLGGRLTTAETVVWPLVHDSFLRHTLAWCWELRRAATYDLAREPWQALVPAESMTQLDIRPYKDSGYWFCAANRANWGYEYGWFSGRAFSARGLPASDRGSRDSDSAPGHAPPVPTFSSGGLTYFRPIVSPLSVHVRSGPEARIPVKHAWGCKMGEVEPVPPALTGMQARVAGSAVEQSLQHVLKTTGGGYCRHSAPACASAPARACAPLAHEAQQN